MNKFLYGRDLHHGKVKATNKYKNLRLNTMVKHRRLDRDIYRSLTRITNLELVYLIRKKLAIFNQVKTYA